MKQGEQSLSVAGIGNQSFEVVDRVSFPTTTPEETMKLVTNYFSQYKSELKAIEMFLLDRSTIPKLLWRNYYFVGAVKAAFSIPVAWTTDVNTAAYREYVAGVAKDLDSSIYYTIGTDIYPKKRIYWRLLSP